MQSLGSRGWLFPVQGATGLLLAAMVCADLTAQVPPREGTVRDAGLKGTLDEIAGHKTTLSGEAVAAQVRLGVASTEASVRQSAMLAVVGRSGGPRFSDTAATRARWRADRSAVQALRPLVLLGLQDPDAKVRAATVIALVNLDFVLGGPANAYPMAEESVTALARTFDSETAVPVRQEIAKTFALSSNDSPEVRRVILDALNNPDPGVRRFGAVGARRLQTLR